MLVKKKTIRKRTWKCQINDRECKLSNTQARCMIEILYELSNIYLYVVWTSINMY